MKTLLEFKEELEKKAAPRLSNREALTLLGLGTGTGATMGALYQSFKAPPKDAHDELEAEMLENQLVNQLRAHKQKKKLQRLQEILDDKRKTLRLG